jgi:hypothetical protein
MLGHKEVRYTEMSSPPRLRLDKDDILINTTRSKEYPDFTIYEILPTVDEGAKVILLKGHEARQRNFVKEFRITVRNKQDSIKMYKLFWVDPDNKKTALQIDQ